MELNLNVSSFENNGNYRTFDSQIYDIIIIGGGPAGLTAAVYCMRKGLNTGIIIKKIGGQVAETAGIENYMGYRYVNGTELTDKFKSQVIQFGIAYEEEHEVVNVEPGPVKKVTLDDGRIFSARALIIATGKTWKKLHVPGEDKLVGRGVAYCAICDAPLFAGKKVIVAGGGNSGVEALIDLAPIATHVTLVHKNEELKADKILQDKIKGFENTDILLSHVIIEIFGENEVTGAMLQNRITGETREIKAEGVFVEIGLIPTSSFVKGVVEMNSFGEIVCDKACRTSEAGIFAAGDVTTTPYKQIIIAAGEGSTAALSAHEYILNQT